MRIPPVIRWIIAAVAFVGTPQLHGQTPLTATLEGQVVDSLSGEPMSGVLVRMDSGPETLSDLDGRFRLLGLASGSHVVALLTEDCRVAWSEVDLEAGAATDVVVRLTVPPGSEEAREREAAERRRAEGRVVTAEEIAKMNAVSLTDVIRRVEPTMVSSPVGYPGAPSPLSGRSPNSLSAPSGENEPVVVIDGVRVADGSRTLQTIDPSDVETLELLSSAAGGWEFGSAGASGVIRVTTRKGGEHRLSGGVEACQVPSFPRR
jgi:hypothetical protein